MGHGYFRRVGIIVLMKSAALVSLLWMPCAPTDAQPATQPLIAPSTQPGAAGPSLDNLIQQLGSDSPDDRDSAQKQLISMGMPAAPALKKAADESDDPEIRSRAAAALYQINDIDSSGASLITLHMQDAPLQDVLTAIGKQSHSELRSVSRVVAGLVGRTLSEPTISVDADHQPFWNVLGDLCVRLKAFPMADYRNPHALLLAPSSRNWMSDSPHQIVGPFWVNIAGLRRIETIDTEGPIPRTDEFKAVFDVLAEPKLVILHLSDLKLKKATDDAGNSLMPQGSLRPVMINLTTRDSTSNHRVECALAYPDHPGKNIAILSGEITADICVDSKTFEIDDVLGAPKVTNPITEGALKVTVSQESSVLYKVSIHCDRNTMNQEQWDALGNHLDGISLEDADGKKLNGYRAMFLPAGLTVLSFTATREFSRTNSPFPAIAVPGRQVASVGEPKRLVWSIPTKIRPYVIPVTFTDIPMP